MKAIIYAGIGLFAVASVYGLADYYNTQKKGTLDKLYKDEATPVEIKKNDPNAIALPVKNVEINNATDKTLAVAVKASKKIKRKIRFEDFSRSRIVEELPVEIAKPETEIKTIPVKKEDQEDNKPMINNKEPERKISLDMFSRAPLRKKVKTETVIKDEPKTILTGAKQ
jgi:hypothetical protein